MQPLTISKSQFKPKALEYLRKVEKEKKPITITHGGKPVVKIVPIGEENEDKLLKKLRDSLKLSVSYYNNPTEPVGVEDWEALK